MTDPLPEGRPAVEQKLTSTCRKLVREIVRQEHKAALATRAAREARDDFAEIKAGLEARFGRELPDDGLLLDLLDLIEVADNDRWLWHGLRNNYGIGIVRDGRSEQSLVRYLAIAFGVIEPEEFGMLFPREVGPGKKGDTLDVNPWHRVLRGTSTAMGNRGRFTLPEVPS